MKAFLLMMIPLLATGCIERVPKRWPAAPPAPERPVPSYTAPYYIDRAALEPDEMLFLNDDDVDTDNDGIENVADDDVNDPHEDWDDDWDDDEEWW